MDWPAAWSACSEVCVIGKIRRGVWTRRGGRADRTSGIYSARHTRRRRGLQRRAAPPGGERCGQRRHVHRLDEERRRAGARRGGPGGRVVAAAEDKDGNAGTVRAAP